MDAAYISDQTIFLAFYRSGFLHSLLPLGEATRYVRNVVLILCLGTLTAHFSFLQRRGRRGLSMVILTTLVLVNFPRPMGGFASNLLLSLLALGMAAGAVVEILREGDYENEPQT